MKTINLIITWQAEDCLSAVMGEILNDGGNRFTCFHCDFNLCRTCVRKNLKRMAAAGGGGSRKVAHGNMS